MGTRIKKILVANFWVLYLESDSCSILIFRILHEQHLQ